MRVAHYLRPATVQALEAELRDYHQTLRSIREIEEGVALPSAVGDEASDRRSNLPSDPVPSRATRMAEYRLLQHMRRITAAIGEVVGELPEDRKKWVYLRYWKRPRLSAEQAAMHANISRRQANTWRRELLSRLADILGEW